MIRFSCPGCSAAFTVADEKAGKAGKCPKCASQFLIPAAQSGEVALAPVPPPPAADEGAVEIAPCPGCGMRLSVATSDIGSEVQCPGCNQVFTAQRPGASASSKNLGDVLGGVSASRAEADADDERPSRHRSRARDADEEEVEERPSRRRRVEDDEGDEDDRPRKKRKKKRRTHDEECKKVTAGLLALLLGSWGVHKFYLGYSGAGVIQLILTFVTCGMAGLIPFIEGIIYLTKSDDEFIETYQIGQKEWF